MALYDLGSATSRTTEFFMLLLIVVALGTLALDAYAFALMH